MIRIVTFSNDYGVEYSYNFDNTNEQNGGLLVSSIEGLGPVKAKINMSDLAGTDGQLFNSATLGGRNIVLSVYLSDVEPAEDERQFLYKLFPLKEKVYITIETDNRLVKTEGYVESVEPNIFDEKASCQVSILCESPYLYALSDSNPLSIPENTTAAINYTGDVPAGFLMRMQVKDNITETSVTAADVYKNGEKCLSFDFTKIKGLVPDSSPNNLPATNAMFSYDTTGGYNYIGELPYSNPACAFEVDGELHIVGAYYDPRSTGVDIGNIPNCKSHYKWNGTTWDKLKDLPKAVFAKATALIFNNQVHMFGLFAGTKTGISYQSNGYKHYTYNPSADSWTLVGNMPAGWGSNVALVCVYHNQIYAISRENQLAATLHKWTSGSTWEFVNNLFYNTGTVSQYDSKIDYSCRVFVNPSTHDDRIHLIGGYYKDTVSTTSPSLSRDSNLHLAYSDDGQNIDYWEELSVLDQENPPVSFADAVVFKNGNEFCVLTTGTYKRLYNYRYYSSSSALYSKGWNWVNMGTNGVSRFNYFEGAVPCIIGDKVYFVGGIASNTITLPPNDVRLIEDDVVEIDTVDGKKNVRLIRKGKVYNIINALGKNPKWFKLVQGYNNIKFSSTGNQTNSMTATIKVRNIYGGV